MFGTIKNWLFTAQAKHRPIPNMDKANVALNQDNQDLKNALQKAQQCCQDWQQQYATLLQENIKLREKLLSLQVMQDITDEITVIRKF